MELMLKMVAMVQLGFADLVDKARATASGARPLWSTACWWRSSPP
jgi:hypothetical protein